MTFRVWFGTALDRLAGWPRRTAALICLALAGASALNGRGGDTIATSPVVVAARALASGSVLQASDVRLESWPTPLRPSSPVTDTDDLIGRRIAGPVAAGEPLTSARLLDTAITSSLRPGQVAVSVRIDSGGQSGLLRPGVLVDLYARPSPSMLVDGAVMARSPESTLVASAVRVLAVFTSDAAQTDAPQTVVLAATKAMASQVANRPSDAFLATLLPPS